jgi:hypothetical protein
LPSAHAEKLPEFLQRIAARGHLALAGSPRKREKRFHPRGPRAKLGDSQTAAPQEFDMFCIHTFLSAQGENRMGGGDWELQSGAVFQGDCYGLVTGRSEPKEII